MHFDYSSLNFSFANAEGYRIAAADRSVAESIAENLRKAADNQRFTIGSTVTARYQYKVGEDGSLIPHSTQITSEAPEDALADSGRRSSRRFTLPDERKSSFTDFMRPKANLSPSDELSIFANLNGAAPTPFGIPLSTRYTTEGFITQATTHATDENGQMIEVELLSPSTSKANDALVQGAVLARAQSAVAGLYTRNSYLAYNVEPAARFAA
jgi:hypothetical protein